ncbi:MAG: gamma-glutamylcyclotransferase [Pseudomonadota bacterium]
MTNPAGDGGARLFFYGTLRDAELREAVLGPSTAGLVARPARVAGFRATPLPGEAFPVAARDATAVLEGVALEGVEAEAVALAQAYEGPEYRLIRVEALLAEQDERVSCLMFAPTEAAARRLDGVEHPAPDWDFERWRQERKPRALIEARELALLGAAPAEALSDRLWPEIRARAARALGEEGEGSIATRLGRADVEERVRVEPYRAFFGFQELDLRHRLYPRAEAPEPGWGGVVRRGVLRSGDGCVILPYDPNTDRVLLVEQFRVALWARGDARPWAIETVAGRLDKALGPEETARAEAREEADLEIGRIERIGLFYSSPGIADEALHYFCGEADLARAGGVFGLPEEGEDIRALALDYETAMTALERGDVNTGPAALALLWLARNRERLRLLWT